MAGHNADVERIRTCDLDVASDRLSLIRDLAAMANSGGGTIVVGARKGGQFVGVAPEVGAKLERVRVERMVEDYIRPDRVAVTVGTTEIDGGKVVIDVTVSAAADPPIVLSQPGVADEHEVFPAHSVVVRRNGKTELARRDDYHRWQAEAVDRLRKEIHERLALVVDAPSDAKVRLVGADGITDEPSYLLSRSSELFRQQPDRLLSTQDLVYLWLNRDTLTVDDEAAELIVQSALRKRTTLYLWLTLLPLTQNQIRAYLTRALTMRDRDKSDAARAMLLVCALYLGEEEYENLASSLSRSSYAHMREAVEALPNIEQARAQLQGERSISSGQEQLIREPDHSLFAQIDELLEQGVGPPRRVPSLGLELLHRKLERQQAPPAADG